MKKLFVLMLALCMLCGAAFAQEAVEFEPIHISLWMDSDAGYEWNCEFDDNGVLTAPMEEITTEGENMGAVHDFYFGAMQPGRAEIIFNYGVAWNVSVPEKTVICSVNVAEDGSNSVYWSECYSDDHMIMVVLPSNPTTGWNWTYQEDVSGMVTLVSEDYAPTDDNLEGAGGYLTYQLKVEKPGDAVLMFNYSNVWDPGAAAAESYSVIVSANEDMEISMTVDQQ